MNQTNNNQQEQSIFAKKPFFLSPVDTSGGVDSGLNSCITFHATSGVCKYQENTCPKNIPKYAMKCVFNKNACRIRKYFKRFEGLDLTKLGIGARR